MSPLFNDVRIALRSLARHRSFSVVAILTLALGAGATTAIFSVVYGVILRPLPYPQPDRIVSVWQTSRSAQGDNGGGTVSHVNYLDWKRDARSFDSLALYAAARLILTGQGQPEVVAGGSVTPDFFRVFGATPVIGREFRADEDRPGGPNVVILGYGFWRERLGGRSDVLSRTITIGGQPRQIVGVAPPGFDFPRGARIWTPVKNDDRACGRSCVYLNGVGRLAPGVSLAAARQEMDAISRRLEEQFPADNNNLLIAVRTLHDETVGSVRNAMVLLLGAVVMVLLIACANIANLLLVRGSSRRSDVAVRAALGAARSRLVMHLLAESIVLAIAGGALGIVVAAWSVDALKQVAPSTIPRLAEVAFDGPTFGFALGLIGLTALVFGLGPAVQLSRVPLTSTLGSRGDVGGGSRRWGRAGLLAAEVGLSLVLLIGAGLLFRTVAALNAIDPGWRADGVSTFMVFLPPGRYEDRAATVRTQDEIASRLAALTGTESVGRISGLPLGRSEDVMNVYRLDRPRPRPGQLPSALYRTVDTGYFRTMGIALVSGRNFNAQDRDGAPLAVIVSHRFADVFYPAENPLGRPVNVAGKDAVIVGVAGDVRSASIEGEPQPEMYVAHAQVATRAMTFVVKSRQPASRVLSDARSVVQSVDPDLPLVFPETMQQVLDRATARPHFYMLLLGLFAALAVLLAAVGVYGVVAYAVSQRTGEIGVRMALGAGRAQVIRLVLWQGLRPAAVGLVAGLAVAFVSGRAIGGELYGVRPHDPATFAAVTIVVLAVVLVACLVPAAKATRVPPATALRGE